MALWDHCLAADFSRRSGTRCVLIIPAAISTWGHLFPGRTHDTVWRHLRFLYMWTGGLLAALHINPVLTVVVTASWIFGNWGWGRELFLVPLVVSGIWGRAENPVYCIRWARGDFVAMFLVFAEGVERKWSAASESSSVLSYFVITNMPCDLGPTLYKLKTSVVPCLKGCCDK